MMGAHQLYQLFMGEGSDSVACSDPARFSEADMSACRLQILIMAKNSHRNQYSFGYTRNNGVASLQHKDISICNSWDSTNIMGRFGHCIFPCHDQCTKVKLCWSASSTVIQWMRSPYQERVCIPSAIIVVCRLTPQHLFLPTTLWLSVALWHHSM